MRIGFALAMAAFLAGSPAMADVVINTDNDAAHHQDRAEQERNAAHRDQQMAREHADAAREHADAARDEAHRADHDTNRDGVRVEIGH